MRKASIAGLALLLVLSAGSAFATAQDTSTQNQAATKAAPAAPSAADIAAAKASHKVWVNLETGIYHKGGRCAVKPRTGNS
jgi:hypothetical protein